MIEKMNKETGFFRKQWTFFKKGKNEINFIMNVYQTIILLFSMSFIGNLPLLTLIILTVLFVLSFIVIANRIGKYTAQKVDPSGYFVSPFFQDQTQYRIALLTGLFWLAYQEGNEKAINEFLKGKAINEKWLKE